MIKFEPLRCRCPPSDPVERPPVFLTRVLRKAHLPKVVPFLRREEEKHRVPFLRKERRKTPYAYLHFQVDATHTYLRESSQRNVYTRWGPFPSNCHMKSISLPSSHEHAWFCLHMYLKKMHKRFFHRKAQPFWPPANAVFLLPSLSRCLPSRLSASVRLLDRHNQLDWKNEDPSLC